MAEQSSDLDAQVTARVQRVVRDLHQEIGNRLEQSSAELLQAIGEFAHQAPEPPAPAATPAPASEPEAKSDPSSGFKALRDALADLDRAESQGEILARLLEQATSFATRVALLLTEPSQLKGWAGVGFEGAPSIEGVLLPYQGQTWSRLLEGEGSLLLDANECAHLCGRIGASTPLDGVLVPLVLRDNVVAALYADRTEVDGFLSLEALQVLTYATAQVLEALPLRQRRSTATLDLAKPEAVQATPAVESLPSPMASEPPSVTEAPPASAPPSAVSGPQDAAIAPPTVESVPPVPDSPVEKAEPSLSPEDLFAEETTAVSTGPPPAQEVQEPGAPPLQAQVGTDGLLSEAERDAGFVVEQLEPLTADESTGPIEESTGTNSDTWTLQEATPVTEERGVESTPLPTAPPPLHSVAGSDLELVETPSGPVSQSGDLGGSLSSPPEQAPNPNLMPADPGTIALPTDPFKPLEATLPESLPLATGATGETGEVEPSGPITTDGLLAPDDSAVDSSEIVRETQLIPLAPGPMGPRSPVPETPNAAPPQDQTLSTAEVMPPSDVQGPGWAFSAQEKESDVENDPVHEEARRLARLLVSEIKLYNEEQIETGRRQGSIYEQLKEDIDRSREMYEERVDEQVRETKDYFHQELVKMLAGGDPTVLGI